MEDRFRLAVREQSRFVTPGGREVAADHAQVRLEGTTGERAAGAQVVHPGALALLLARKPVRIEGAQQDAFLVPDLVVAHVRMPDPGVRGGRDRQAEHALDDAEHPMHDALQREVRPQRLVVDVVVLPS